MRHVLQTARGIRFISLDLICTSDAYASAGEKHISQREKEREREREELSRCTGSEEPLVNFDV